VDRVGGAAWGNPDGVRLCGPDFKDVGSAMSGGGSEVVGWNFGARIGGGRGSADAMKSQVSKILTFNAVINSFNYRKYYKKLKSWLCQAYEKGSFVHAPSSSILTACAARGYAAGAAGVAGDVFAC
jgi:hypothetical protein